MTPECLRMRESGIAAAGYFRHANLSDGILPGSLEGLQDNSREANS
jgi:hypothetical protein